MAMTTNDQERFQEQPNALNLFFARAITINWEVVAYLVIFILAVFTRFYLLGDRTMSHDESLHTKFSFDLYDRGVFRHTPLMHGPILFHFTALSYWLFGATDFSARIYTAVLGVGVVMFPLLFRHWLGRTGALLAALMLLISPLMLYYSRYIRHDIPSIISALFMFYAIMMYLSGPQNQRRRAHWLYILAAAMLWNLGSKETAFIYVAIFGAFLTIYWMFRLAQHFYNVRGKIMFETFIIGGLLASVMALAMIVVISITLGSQILPLIDQSGTTVTLGHRLTFLAEQFSLLLSGGSVSTAFLTFISWSGLVVVAMLSIVILPAIWVYRKSEETFTLMDGGMTILAFSIFAVVFTLLSGNQITITSDAAGNAIENIVNTSAAAFAVAVIVSLSSVLVYAAYRIKGERTRAFKRQLLVVLALMFVLLTVLIVFEERSHVSPSSAEVSAPQVPGQEIEGAVSTSSFTVMPLILVWVLGSVAIFFMLYTHTRGWWKVLDNFPEFDILMVMGSLILPWLTAVFIVSTNATSADFISIGEGVGALQRVLPVAGAERAGQFLIGFLAWVPMMATAVIAGLLWNWRRWLIASLVFHTLFAFFFTTVFTNIEGLASGMVYSLQYWLEQQAERRGNQPQYYYLLVIMPFYELLPIIGGFLAMIAGMVFFWRKQRRYEEEITDAEVVAVENTSSAAEQEETDVLVNTPQPTPNRWQITQVPFLLFVGFWGVANLYGYTLAGEKMPWLGTHLTLPLILLTAWYFGRVFENLDWRKFMERGWLYLLLLPFLFIGVFQAIAPFMSDQQPFLGTSQTELQWTYGWLAVMLIVIGILYAVLRLMKQTGYTHLRQMIAIVGFTLLAVITFRSAWMSSFIYYDEATEFLVYAHAGPANKEITEGFLADLSFRITDGMDAKVMYDDRFSWPGSWYMRNYNNAVFIGGNAPTLQQLDDTVAVIIGTANRAKVEPLVEDTFQRFDHIRMWWPIQDYFALTADDMSNLFDLSAANSGTLRRGLFNIWWNRDYSTYSRATGQNITLTNWPVSERMHLYIRRDYAAQVWPYGVGDSTVSNPFTQVETNVCVANWQMRPASVVFDTSAQRLFAPIGITVADGQVYVADDPGHRVNVFSTDGSFISSFGQQGTAVQEGAFFERPHSVAIGPDGSIYVADTWNYRIRKFTPNLSYVTGWGQALTLGFDAQQQPVDGFWGPRDIAADNQGRVYVADTGNKRVRVYDSNGNFVRDIGSGGTGEGQLNEPSGIALHPDGRVFVADTWNRRVAVFNSDGTFLTNYPVRGWREELGNRPYIALDPERNLLYITDPDAGRVLVYDIDGNCLGSFGQLNRENPSAAEFGTIGGVAVDADGNLYVVDLGVGRVLRFDPYERPILIEPAEDIEAQPDPDASSLDASDEDSVLPPPFLQPGSEADGPPFEGGGDESGFPLEVNPPGFSAETTEEVGE